MRRDATQRNCSQHTDWERIASARTWIRIRTFIFIRIFIFIFIGSKRLLQRVLNVPGAIRKGASRAVFFVGLVFSEGVLLAFLCPEGRSVAPQVHQDPAAAGSLVGRLLLDNLSGKGFQVASGAQQAVQEEDRVVLIVGVVVVGLVGSAFASLGRDPLGVQRNRHGSVDRRDDGGGSEPSMGRRCRCRCRFCCRPRDGFPRQQRGDDWQRT
mmetsp:Transcript_28488/g.66855  ORF Transcript_28488/g.66855 Transcript_28488/m.66855 type:complete len:211 (+) Transcript_28488:280-912(+)